MVVSFDSSPAAPGASINSLVKQFEKTEPQKEAEKKLQKPEDDDTPIFGAGNHAEKLRTGRRDACVA